jgi:soluble lytic murein transglycosylase-like protein
MRWIALARSSLSRPGMNGPSLPLFALALAASSCTVHRPSHEPVTDEASSLRGTLRRTEGARPAPAWLESLVCQRGAALGEACDDVAGAIAQEAAGASLDPILLLAMIEVESAWDARAVSDRNARGLMQLRQPALQGEARGGRLPSTDPHDPLVNVRAGIRYYARMVRRFEDPELALVAYNAGPARLSGYLRAEEGVPERFWEYPRRVRREERRLRSRIAPPERLLAANGAARVGE